MRNRATTLIAAFATFVAANLVSVLPAIAAEDVTVSATLVNGYSPKNLVIETGTTVTWKNDEKVPPLRTAQTGDIALVHHVQSADGRVDSGELKPGQSFSMTFNEPFKTTYVCDLHPQLMTGTIEVQGKPFVPPATEKTIKIVEPGGTSTWGYDPDELEVVTGTTITWRNAGDTAHTVTAKDGSFDSGSIAPGAKFVKTFNKPVALTYFCEPHPWMTGTLVVANPGEKPPVPQPEPTKPGSKPGNQTPPPINLPERVGNEPTTFQAQIVEGSVADPDSWGYAPETLTVRAGDTVVWTNAGSVQHTVTATDLSFDSGMMDSGATWSKTFDTVGTFAFACAPHPWMTGAVQVAPAGSDASTLPPPPVAPQPEVDAPGTPTTPGTDGPSDGGSGGGDSEPHPAWSLGDVPLAAATGAGLLGVGLLFIVPLAAELRRQTKVAVASATTPAPAPTLLDLTEPEPEPQVFEIPEPVRVAAASKPMRSTATLATAKTKRPATSTARVRATAGKTSRPAATGSSATRTARTRAKASETPARTRTSAAAPARTAAKKATTAKASKEAAAPVASRRRTAGSTAGGTRVSRTPRARS